MRSIAKAPITKWSCFADSITRTFGSNRETDSDMAPARCDDHMNDYIDNFIAYAHHINLESEQHQVSLFVHGLQHELREALVRHLSLYLGTAINFAHTLDNIIAITLLLHQLQSRVSSFNRMPGRMGCPYPLNQPRRRHPRHRHTCQGAARPPYSRSQGSLTTTSRHSSIISNTRLSTGPSRHTEGRS